MPLPNAARLAAALAPGKRLTVIIAGASFALPAAPEAPADKPATPDAPTPRAELPRAEVEEIRRLLEETIKGQERIVETLMLPVVPTGYDKSGRITAAQRKKT